MACGFGACFGCAVPLAGGGYMRLCVDGPVRRAATRSRPRWCEAVHRATCSGRASAATRGSARAPGDQRLGHLRRDRRPARLRRRSCSSEFPFSAFVSKTITPEPRAGNPPPRLWETPAGMINSIGLPNKGLEGFLAEDLPQLAELPVPLIVSVMATSHEEFARLVDGVGGARGGRGDRAQRLLPQRPLRADRRRAAGGDRGAAGGAAAADREAADREADAERRRPGRGRRRRRGGRGRRGLADQHAEGERDRPATGEPWLGGRTRRPLRARRCGRSPCPGRARSRPRSRSRSIGMGGISSGRRRGANSSRAGAHAWSPSGRRASATRAPGSRIAAELAERSSRHAEPSSGSSTSSRG